MEVVLHEHFCNCTSSAELNFANSDVSIEKNAEESVLSIQIRRGRALHARHNSSGVLQTQSWFVPSTDNVQSS